MTFALVIYTFSALLLLRNVDSARVLALFPQVIKSHQIFFEPLLRTLAEKGHQVTVVSFYPLDKPPVNYTDVSLKGLAPLAIEVIDVSLYENAYFIPIVGKLAEKMFSFLDLAAMALDLCEKMIVLPELKEIMSRDYDVVLVENFNSDCMLGLMQVYGVTAPIVALSSCNLLPWSAERLGLVGNPAYVPLITTAFTNKMNFYERLENTLHYLGFKYLHKNVIQIKEQEMIEKHFGRKIINLQDLALNMSIILVNTFHSLNGIRPAVPGLIEVGGMHLHAKPKPIPLYIEKFLNESTDGVILFSWGSFIKTSTIPQYKEEIIIKVLSKLRQRVIWKYEESGPEGTLIGNILRVRWVPQYQLLRHKKVIAFIAHGGLLGMTEAISSGKPMLIIPFFGDQPQNAEAAAAAGLGTILQYAELNEQTFEAALKKVLSAEMKLSARRASRIWSDRPAKPLDTAVYWTERTTRWGNAAPLYSVAAKEMPVYQILLLDVILTILLIICLALFILHLLTKKIIRIVKTFVFLNKNKVD